MVFLGVAETGHIIMALHSTSTINEFHMFPQRKIMQCVYTGDKNNPRQDDIFLEILAFEFGKYKTLQCFQDRTLQLKRSHATQNGVLTCKA